MSYKFASSWYMVSVWLKTASFFIRNPHIMKEKLHVDAKLKEFRKRGDIQSLLADMFPEDPLSVPVASSSSSFSESFDLSNYTDTEDNSQSSSSFSRQSSKRKLNSSLIDGNEDKTTTMLKMTTAIQIKR